MRILILQKNRKKTKKQNKIKYGPIDFWEFENFENFEIFGFQNYGLIDCLESFRKS